MASHEILTVQLGHLSNYVGAHYWNQQDEYFTQGSDGSVNYTDFFDMDRLYRSGSTSTGQPTLTPRALIFDLSGNFGTLNPTTGTLYADTSAAAAAPAWQGRVATMQAQRAQKNKFLTMLEREEKAWREGVDLAASPGPEEEVEDYELESSVNTWSDYLKAHIHPKSLASLHVPDYEVDFRHYLGGLNQDLVSRDDMDNFYDQFRYFLEECDRLQAIQLFADLTDGFGGLTSRFLDLINDECPNAAVILQGIVGDNMHNVAQSGQQATHKDRLQQVSLAFSYANILPKVSVMLPVSMASIQRCSPYLDVDPRSLYHTSAVLAATYETYTTGFRQRSQGISAHQWCHAVTGEQRYKLLSTETCLPLPWRQLGAIDRAFSALQSAVPDRSATDALWSQYRLNPFATSLFPRHHLTSAETPVDSRGFANSLFLRSQPSQPSSDAIKDVFAPYMRSGCVLSHVSAEQVPLPLPISFPKFFRGVDEETATPLVPDEDIVFPQPGHAQVGYTSHDRRVQCLSTAAGAAIGAGPFMYGHLHQVAQDFRNRRPTVSAQLSKVGLLQEDLADMEETLFNLADKYRWDESLEA